MNLPLIDLRTEDQCIQYVESLIRDMIKARDDCRIGILVVEQKRAWNNFLLKHGAVLGALVVMQSARLISDRAYTELRQRTLNTMVGDVVRPK